MNATVLSAPATNKAPIFNPYLEDPLDHDLSTDHPVLTTRRALCRVVTVAAEAGARFQREGSAVDPVGWMLAPRQLFGGAAALEACLDRTHFINAVMLHGLSLGLDANAAIFDMSDVDDDEDDAGLDADSDALEPDIAAKPTAAVRSERHHRRVVNRMRSCPPHRMSPRLHASNPRC